MADAGTARGSYVRRAATGSVRTNEPARDRPLALLIVQRGRHAGARVSIYEPEFLIGSAMDCGAVLTDPGVEAHHCVITIGRRFMRPAMSVLAADGAVTSNGRTANRGGTLDLEFPATIRLAGAEVQIESAPRAPRQIGRKLIVPASIAGAALLGYGYAQMTSRMPKPWADIAQSPGVGGQAPGRTTATQQSSLPSSQSASGSQGGTAPASGQTASKAPTDNAPAEVTDLRQRLLRVGLPITVEKRGNAVVAEGTVDGERYAQWREAKLAFLTANSNRVVVDMVKLSTAATPSRGLVASVVYGTTPYIISTSGRRARVGEVIDDGWVVESIRADSVNLKRGSATTTIPLTGGGQR